MKKLIKAAKDTGIRQVAIAGGVSANTGLQKALIDAGKKYKLDVFIPKFKFSTDNAAMIACAGYHKYLKGIFCDQTAAPFSKTTIK